jgi:hypothetical protein
MMKSIAKLLSLSSVIAALCLPAAVLPQDAPPGAATISDPGGSDLSGFTIVIDPSGHAWALDGAGHTTGDVNLSVTQAFFTDLAAAGSLAQLPERPCEQDVVIGWNGQRTPNIACSSDQRALRLMSDVAAIQRALYVQSYHTSASVARSTVSYGARPANGQTYSRTSAWYSPTGGGTSFYANPSSYAGSSSAYNSTIGSGRFANGSNGLTGSRNSTSFADTMTGTNFSSSRFPSQQSSQGFTSSTALHTASSSLHSSNLSSSMSTSSFGQSSFGTGAPVGSSPTSSSHY